MYLFKSLYNAGASVAAMSDESDGDCGWDSTASGGRTPFLEHLGVLPEKLFSLRQVHGDQIVEVDEHSPGQGARTPSDAFGDGDGLVTATPGLPIAVTVADCVPVLLFDPVTRAVAALHGGRAGTTARIAATGLALLVSRFGAEPADVRAVIGPSAGPCCYEVSPEMRAECVAQGVVAQGNKLDLWASNHVQLRDGGVLNRHIEISGHCTLCMGQFYSYRRQHTGKRNLAVIAV